MGFFSKLRRLSNPRPPSLAQSRPGSRLGFPSIPPGKHESLDVIVAGMEGVGKKSLITTFCTPETPEYNPHGPFWDTGYIQEKLGISQTLCFYTAPGQSLLEDNFRSLRGRKDVAALMLVYDVSNRRSFMMLPLIRLKITALLHSGIGPPLPLFVVGLKSDLLQDRWAVTPQEAKEFADRIGAQWGTCSALKGDGLDDIMIQMAKAAVKQRPKKLREPAVSKKETEEKAKEDEENEKAKYYLPMDIITRSRA